MATGDVNNDTIADLIIGAPTGDPWGATDAGESYVLLGPLGAGTLELSTEADITINDIDAGDGSGGGVATGPLHKPESTEGGRRVSVLKRQEGAPVNLG